MSKKILATSWHPGGANAIVPVVKRLREEGKVDVVAIGHQYSEDIFRREGINYRAIMDYGLSDVSLGSMERVLNEENPGMVLTGTSVQDDKNREVIEQTLTLTATQRGISTLAVLDFWANYWQRFSDIYSEQRFRFLPDKVAIMDEYAKAEMLKEGFEESRLVITGNPHFDGLEAKAREFTKKDREEVRNKIGLNPNVLGFFAGTASWKNETERFGFWDLDIIKIVNEFFQSLSNSDYGMVAKLHPRAPKEDLDEAENYVEQNSGGKIKLVRDIDAQKLILASDITFTPFSTLGFEAVYMKKPLISLQPGLKCQDYLSVLTTNGIIPVGYRTSDCRDLVSLAFKDRRFREEELIEEASSFRTEGKATERVTNLVYEMIGEK